MPCGRDELDMYGSLSHFYYHQEGKVTRIEMYEREDEICCQRITVPCGRDELDIYMHRSFSLLLSQWKKSQG